MPKSEVLKPRPMTVLVPAVMAMQLREHVYRDADPRRDGSARGWLQRWLLAAVEEKLVREGAWPIQAKHLDVDAITRAKEAEERRLAHENRMRTPQPSPLLQELAMRNMIPPPITDPAQNLAIPPQTEEPPLPDQEPPPTLDTYIQEQGDIL